MTKILTVCQYKDDEVLRNHSHYAQLYGYEHHWVETAFMEHHRLRVAYKYNYLSKHLKASAPGELVVLLDGHTAIFNPLDIEEAMQGKDSFVCNGPENPGQPFVPMNNLLVVRNTPENRARMHEMLYALHGMMAAQTHHLDEYGWLQKFDLMPTNATLKDTYMNVNWTIANWFHANIFAIQLGMGTSVGADGTMRRDMVHDSNLEKILLKQINGRMIEGKPLMQAPNYDALSADAQSHYNPEASIAFVTLYTPQINTYARISEHNVKRYCDRHGYAYHVYRDIPEGVDANIMGSWLKPLVLEKHFAQHEWVIWIDADVLFRNPALKFEPLLEGRDVLFAKDLCNWPMNSGVMGFRNTPANKELIAKLWQRMRDIQDKSTIYSEMGDQFHIINVLNEMGMLTESNVVSSLVVNTPPPLSNNDTLLTHYVGTGEPYRSIYMAHDDAQTLRRG